MTNGSESTTLRGVIAKRVTKGSPLLSKKPPTTGDRLRAQHQWHARFARGGFSTMIFPIKEMATPPVKIHWW
ncbi:MAG TPA: hypothetical protein VJI98_03055, partial [Candidatus Nanoarchaeia archaeon]|nr:hypothetical protein [Candidatus Nanoarchaeia archaeon]